jgi:chromosomal replication initiation ATPase DnaA
MPDDPPSPLPILPALVLDIVAAAYGLTTADLTGHNRARPRGEARRVAYRLLHDESRLSWPGVGLVMNRHQTTGLAQAARADPAALELLRHRLHLNGSQGSLW